MKSFTSITMILSMLIVGILLGGRVQSAEAARPKADLSIQISQPSTVVVRSAGTYSVTVDNQGGRHANNVQLVIDLPLTNNSPTQYIMGEVSNVSSQCQLADNRITCSLGNIRKNKDASVSFDLSLPVSTNILSVTAMANTDSTEDNLQNNSVTIIPAIQYPDNQLSGGLAINSRCTGQNLSAFYECELAPSSIQTYGADFVANGTMTFTGQSDYRGDWNQLSGNNTLSFTIEQISTTTIVAEFNGYSIGGNCFEGILSHLTGNGDYVSPTKVCF